MSYKAVNSLIKAVKDKKFTKMTTKDHQRRDCYALWPFRKSSGKTVNAAYIKKVLATSQLTFKLKRSGLWP